MRLYIMSDLEGVAGVINGADYLYPTGRYYDLARRLLTAEVNAAIEGFAEAGFGEFLVADGHGAGAINIELLDARARLARGWAPGAYPFGLDASFDAIAWVGQHAKAGTPCSHLTHTGWWNVKDQQLNGISIGEFGEMAFCAGELGVPVIFGSGEKAFGEEVKALTPWAHTVAVLEGINPEKGDDLDGEAYEKFHEAAVHLTPAKSRELIRAAALEAGRHFAASPGDFKPLTLDPPYELVVYTRAYKGAPAGETRTSDDKSIIRMFQRQVLGK